jgi:PAS domain S-box-containing protein
MMTGVDVHAAAEPFVGIPGLLTPDGYRIFETLFADAPVGAAILDRQQRFVRINRLLADLNGRSPSEHLGRTIREVLGDVADLSEPDHRQVLETGRALESRIQTAELPGRPGELRTWSSTFFPVRGEDGEPIGTGVVVVDITDKSKFEDALRRVNRRLEGLHDIDRLLMAAPGFEAVAGRVLQRLREVVPFDRASVVLFEPDGRQMRFVAVVQDRPYGPQQGAIVPYGTEEDRERLWRDVWNVPDIAALDPLIPPLRGLVEAGLRSGLDAALETDGRHVGNLFVLSREAWAFDENDEEVVRAAANQLAIALAKFELEDRLAERAREAELLAEERRALLETLVGIQEDERARIARELHDDLGQTLTSLSLALADAELDLTDGGRARMGELRARVGATIADLRLLVWRLHPVELDLHGLEPAFDRLAVDARDRGLDVQVELQVGGRLSPAVEATVFRVVQEALTNASRHAAAATVSLVIQRQEDRIVAIVEDDGEGFDPPKAHGGFGLVGMRERAARLGGVLTVESAPGAGTTIRLEVPVS